MDKYEFEILGAFAFSVENNLDERGSLIRIFDSVDLFPNFKVVQASYVENPIDGTLRGLHFQAQEHAENKIVQCVSGKIYDVIVDIDKESRTYGKVCSVQLGPKEKFQGIFIPSLINKFYPQIEFNLMFKTPKTIGNFFNFKYKTPQHLRSKVVYKVSCFDCDGFYIGFNL